MLGATGRVGGAECEHQEVTEGSQGEGGRPEHRTRRHQTGLRCVRCLHFVPQERMNFVEVITRHLSSFLKHFLFDHCLCPVKKETAVKKLRDDKVRLEQEVEELEHKVERMSTMAKQVSTLLELAGLLIYPY